MFTLLYVVIFKEGFIQTPKYSIGYYTTNHIINYLISKRDCLNIWIHP